MPNGNAQRVVQVDVTCDAPGLESALRLFDEAEANPACRVVLVGLRTSSFDQSPIAQTLSSRFRNSGKVVIGTLSGQYGADGVTLAAGADLVIGSDETELALDVETVGFDASWFPNLTLRDLKWLALCAGSLNAGQLAKSGFLNFVCPASDVRATAECVAQDIARVPGDVLTLKKRAHDTRHRLATTTGR